MGFPSYLYCCQNNKGPEEEKPAHLRIPSPIYRKVTRAPLARVLSFSRKMPYLCLQHGDRIPLTQEHNHSEALLEGFFFMHLISDRR